MDLNRIFDFSINEKIIRFFHENPSCVDTARGIAAWVNENRREVKAALEKFVHLNILIAHRSLFTTGYSYTQNKEITSLIDDYLKNKAI